MTDVAAVLLAVLSLVGKFRYQFLPPGVWGEDVSVVEQSVQAYSAASAAFYMVVPPLLAVLVSRLRERVTLSG